MGSVWAIVGIGLVFLVLLLIRVAFLLVLRSGETKAKSPAVGPPPRVIKAAPTTPASESLTHETNHDDHR